ncbi:MAG: right-handed parallel beta-helix repeat-containing protein [Planctomycetota bacterium]
MDSSDIRMENCFFGANLIGDDALHWGYVKNSVVVNSRFEGARSDAFDVDISEGIRVQGCEFFGSINDGLDIMTSAVYVADCSFEKAGDKGISVGEASTLQLDTSTFTRCVIGVEIKDNSEAHIDNGTAFFSCPIAVNLYRKNERYSKGGRLYAGELHTTDCEEDWKADKRSHVFLAEQVLRQQGQ